MSTVSVTDARAALPELLDRVAAGEEVAITRHGRQVAVLIRPDALRVRRAGPALAEAEELRDFIARRGAAPLSDDATLSSERGEELARSVHADRSGR